MCPIKGISSIYRPVRQGKIHLGVKVTKKRADGAEVSYPSEVDFFVLKDAPELIPFYGEKPTSLNVMLPSARFERENLVQYLEKVIPQYLKRYRTSGLLCKGDGETATSINEETGAMEEQSCPCDYLDKGECRRIGILRIRVQEIASFGIYQITTSSFNSIVNLNSFIRDLCEHCLVNRIDISQVKLILKRIESDVQRLEKGKVRKSTHHIMALDLDPRFYKSLDEVRIKALQAGMGPTPQALPPPDESPDTLYLGPREVQPNHADAPSSESFHPQVQAEKKKPDQKTSGLHDLGAEQGFPEGPPASKTCPAAQSQGSALFKEDLEIEEEKKSLQQVIAEFEKLGGKLGEDVLAKIAKFKTKEEYSIAIGYYRAQASKRRKRKTRPEGL